MRTLFFAVVLACASASAVHADPPQSHEILEDRPSGFWTSNRPATNGAYRYRLLLIGTGIAGVMGFFMVRLLRKASRERDAQ